MHCTWLTRITVQVHVAFLPQHLKAETKLRGLAVTKAGWVPRSLRKWNDPIRPFWIAKEWQTGKWCWCCNFGYLFNLHLFFPAGCTEKGDGNQNRSSCNLVPILLNSSVIFPEWWPDVLGGAAPSVFFFAFMIE